MEEKEAALEERRAAEQAVQPDSEPDINEPFPATPEVVEPTPPATEDDPLALLWDDFDNADYEGKIALFYQALENEEIQLDGQFVFDMFDVFYRETLNRDERDRFNAIAAGRREDVALHLLNYQVFKAAATFELIPAWLEYLRTRELLMDAISAQTLQDLQPLHEPLLQMYRHDKTDPALFAALESWPYQGN